MVSTEHLILNVPRLAAGAMMLGLCAWVLLIDFRSKVFRAFALFLVLRGFLNLFLVFGPASTAASNANLWATYGTYYQIAVPFAAFAFVVRMQDPEGKRRRSTWTLVGLLAAALILELVYLLDHSTYFGHRAGGTNWLFLTIGLGDVAYVAAAHALLRIGPQRRYIVAAIGFLLFPAFAAGQELALFVRFATGATALYSNAESWFFVAIRVGALAYTGFVLSRCWNTTVGRMGAIVTVTAFATGLAWAPIYLITGTGKSAWQFSTVMNGLWTAAMPFAVGHALLRGRLPEKLQQLAPAAWLTTTAFFLITAALFVSVQGLREAGILLGVVGVTLLTVLALGSIERNPPTESSDS